MLCSPVCSLIFHVCIASTWLCLANGCANAPSSATTKVDPLSPEGYESAFTKVTVEFYRGPGSSEDANYSTFDVRAQGTLTVVCEVPPRVTNKGFEYHAELVSNVGRLVVSTDRFSGQSYILEPASSNQRPSEIRLTDGQFDRVTGIDSSEVAISLNNPAGSRSLTFVNNEGEDSTIRVKCSSNEGG